ncbi:hypothetical protein CIP106467_2048 [Citrobacter europaeus]|nr:hypothetical protein CIP106467_2048 [Citrobacter europaeus]
MIFISAASAEYDKGTTCAGGGKEQAISEKEFRSPHAHRFNALTYS